MKEQTFIRLILALIFSFSVYALPSSVYASPGTPWLGVSVDDLSFEQLKDLGLDFGLKIEGVTEDSPAGKAGLKGGDILLTIDGRPVYSFGRLQWLVHSYPAGEEVTITYSRDGKEVSAAVVLGSWEERARRHYGPHSGHHKGSNSYLGVLLQPMTDGLREHFGAAGDVGMLISEVVEGSPAAKAKLNVGDVVIRMDRKAIRDMGDVRRVLNFFEPGDKIEVEVIRDNSPMTHEVELGKGGSKFPGRSMMPHGYGPGVPHHDYQQHYRYHQDYPDLPPGFPFPFMPHQPIVPDRS